MSDEDRIREMAVRFREAIQKCDMSELPISLANFPTGSCADASMLFGTYLKENGITGFILIKGKRGEGNSLETHYWLEKGDILVDITADQFEDINEEIIIADTNYRWYGAFEKEVRKEADYRLIAVKDVREHLEAVYDYVLEADQHDR
jgi:hypothetical protein